MGEFVLNMKEKLNSVFGAQKQLGSALTKVMYIAHKIKIAEVVKYHQK